MKNDDRTRDLQGFCLILRTSWNFFQLSLRRAHRFQSRCGIQALEVFPSI